MAEPKKRLTSARSGKRRSHLVKKAQSLSLCPKCKSYTLAHRVCPTCGFYRGNDILKIAEKTKAKEDRRKKREEETLAEKATDTKTKEK